MNPARIIKQELILYWHYFTRSYFWLIITVAFIFVAMLVSHQITTGRNFQYYPVRWDYFSVLKGVTNYGIFFYISSSILISEERENASWDTLKSTGVSKGYLILGKLLWIQLFSLLLLGITEVMTTIFLLSDSINISLGDVFSVLLILCSFWLLVLPFNLQGLVISSLFSKKINSAIFAVSLWVFLSILGTYIMGYAFLHNIPEPPTPGAFFNIPIGYKVILLAYPYYLYGYMAILNNLTNVEVSIGARNSLQLYNTVIFKPPGTGYIIAFIASLVVYTSMVFFLVKLKDEWRILYEK